MRNYPHNDYPYNDFPYQDYPYTMDNEGEGRHPSRKRAAPDPGASLAGTIAGFFLFLILLILLLF